MTEAMAAALGWLKDVRSAGIVAVGVVATAAFARTETNAAKIREHDSAIKYVVCTQLMEEQGISPVPCRLFLRDRIEDFLPPGAPVP